MFRASNMLESENMDSIALPGLCAKKLARRFGVMSKANGATRAVNGRTEDLTIAEISNISGVEAGKIAALLADGAADISLTEGAQIADALGVDLPELLGRAA